MEGERERERMGEGELDRERERERGQRLDKRSQQGRMERAHLSVAGDHGRPETLRSLQS